MLKIWIHLMMNQWKTKTKWKCQENQTDMTLKIGIDPEKVHQDTLTGAAGRDLPTEVAETEIMTETVIEGSIGKGTEIGNGAEADPERDIEIVVTNTDMMMMTGGIITRAGKANATIVIVTGIGTEIEMAIKISLKKLK